MPRNSRDLAKRKINSTIDKINWAGTYVHELTEIYFGKEAEIEDALDITKRFLLLASKAMDHVNKIA